MYGGQPSVDLGQQLFPAFVGRHVLFFGSRERQLSNDHSIQYDPPETLVDWYSILTFIIHTHYLGISEKLYMEIVDVFMFVSEISNKRSQKSLKN